MLTPEQENAANIFATGSNEIVVAFAGAGKTSTLRACAEKAPRKKGLYVAFNRSIADEAASKFPSSVLCKTAHSLAYRAVANQGYSSEKMTKNARYRDYPLPSNFDEKLVHENIFRNAVGQTIRRFCHSAATDFKSWMVPKINGLTDEAQAYLQVYAPAAAAVVWGRMISLRDPLPMGFDGYLKLWALGNPVLDYDYILLDEAQDLNGVLIGIAKHQKCQVVAVGDTHQQIYEWRGAIDALKILQGTVARLTKSFRFGENIAREANRVLAAMGELHPLVGHDPITDHVHYDTLDSNNVDAVLCRSNAGVIDQAFHFVDLGREVSTPGGTGELSALVDDAIALQSNRRAKTQDLMAFENWHQVVEYTTTDEGAGLKVFVNLVNRYGVDRLKGILAKINPNPVPGGVTISTTHKAKGLEWKSVKINDDFSPQSDKIGMAERRLFYVAITRAKNNLYVDRAILDKFATTIPVSEEEE